MDARTRRQNRAAEREKLRQRDLQRKRQLKYVLIGVAALAVVIILAVFVLPSACSGPETGIEGDDASMTTDPTDEEMQQSFAQYYFYEEERSERYLKYQIANPDLTPEQVVVRVNVDLDSEAYEITTPVSDPNSLLALVSKHFYLPSDYEPTDLVRFGEAEIRSEAAQPLEQLLAAASGDGVSLLPASGFRTASRQDDLYSGYHNSLGQELADIQSARAGFSEHQTGYVIDFNPTNYLFYDTPQAHWLEENAHTYGFIVRFTEENSDITLYIHEPWHLRYVGVEIANFMKENNIGSFEEYWVKYVQHSPS